VNTELSKRLRLLASAISVLVVLAGIAVGWIYSRVRASLPQLDGRAAVAGLGAPVSVQRDNLGVPTIEARSRIDAARALGFVHAQDRFFQMDVWRRAAAGELSAVFGSKTLEHDRATRIHGFRKLARETLARLPADQRALLEAYAAGVNAGLAALREKPFEYLVVRATPEPWKPEDTFLVSDAMLLDLQDSTGTYERTLTTLRDQFGQAGLDAFAPLLTPDDAALDGSKGAVPELPGPRVIDLRQNSTAANPATLRQATLGMPGAGDAVTVFAPGGLRRPPTASPFAFLERDPAATPGSNAFALAGSHTANGGALLAGDIHLNLRVPNVWYRAQLRYPGHAITGITLPGIPLIIAGSNGHVAWSFTNSYADTGDLVSIDVNPLAPTLYRAPGRSDLLEFERRHEVIAVAGAHPESVDYQWSVWGPIVAHAEDGRPLAYLWTGHDPDATNLELLRMEDAANVTDAIEVAHRVGMPAQNIVIADQAGDVAWTIAGKLPRRVGYDGRLPVTFRFGDRSWAGFVPSSQVPVVSTRFRGGADALAQDGRIWSANQRMIGGDGLKTIGDGGYARPSRARQMRDDLARLEHATPRDLLAIQLDDRAEFLGPWHQLLMQVLTPQVTAQKRERADLRRYAEHWEGRASVDAITYPIVKLFRIAVYTRVFIPIFKTCTTANPDFNWSQLLLEPAVWKMLREKPANLLDAQYPSWDALLVAAVDDTINELNRNGVRLPYATWGERNRAVIRHPFSYTLPWFLRSRLDMPADPLPGDVDMPRVQTPPGANGLPLGASERFVVSPGHEDEGIFEMPCGQSGHPLSPYYRAGHEAWVRGDPTPFLPGRPEHTLTLAPR
jgi:penicillin amidase